MDEYLAIFGFIVIFAVVGILVWGKVSPIVAIIFIF